MPTAIIKDKFGESLHLQCTCGAFEVVQLNYSIDEDDGFEEFYFTITADSKTLLEKLKVIWRVIRGSKYGITDTVCFEKEEAKALIKWLEEKLDEKKKKV